MAMLARVRTGAPGCLDRKLIFWGARVCHAVKVPPTALPELLNELRSLQDWLRGCMAVSGVQARLLAVRPNRLM
jgi:hypothetical protein